MKQSTLACVLCVVFLRVSTGEEPVKALRCPAEQLDASKPYITTRSPITLLSANDAEVDFLWRKNREGLRDREVKSQDSITVIHLGPDHSPISRTVYGTVPSTILGTPTMAMSADGRYGIIANHGFRGTSAFAGLIYPNGTPLTNADIRPGDLTPQKNRASPVEHALSD